MQKAEKNCHGVVHDVVELVLNEFLNDPIFIHRLKEELKKVD